MDVQLHQVSARGWTVGGVACHLHAPGSPPTPPLLATRPLPGSRAPSPGPLARPLTGGRRSRFSVVIRPPKSRLARSLCPAEKANCVVFASASSGPLLTAVFARPAYRY